jgi:HPt (histidine-containing phosphotransfer) domain-containing protein
MNDYISKPFERERLLATVEHWIRPGAESESAPRPANPGEAADGEPPVFDDSSLARLAGEVPDSEFRTLIDAYLTGAAALLADAEAAAAKQDFGSLTQAAHDLISTSGNFGVPRVQRLARRIEAACKAGQCAEAVALTAGLRFESEAAWAALRGRFPAAVARMADAARR